MKKNNHIQVAAIAISILVALNSIAAHAAGMTFAIRSAANASIPRLLEEFEVDTSLTAEEILLGRAESILRESQPDLKRGTVDYKFLENEILLYLRDQVSQKDPLIFLTRDIFGRNTYLAELKALLYPVTGSLSPNDLKDIQNIIQTLKKEKRDRTLKTAAEETAQTVVSVGVGTAFSACMGPTTGPMASAAALWGVVNNISSHISSSGSQALFSNPAERKFNQLRIVFEFLRRRKLISESNIAVLAPKFKQQADLLANQPGSEGALNEINRSIEQCVLLPTITKEVDAFHAAAELDEILKSYQNHSNESSDETHSRLESDESKDSMESREQQDQLTELIKEITLKSLLPDDAMGDKRTIAYFKGPSRTGKTRLAENLGKILDLPICVIKADELNEQLAAEDAVANLFSPTVQASSEFKLVAAMNKCLVEQRDSHGMSRKNMIFVFDEIDKVIERNPRLHDFMYSLLETEDGSSQARSSVVNNKWTNLGIDLSRATFILTGNRAIKSKDGSGALENRIKHHIEFRALPRRVKMNIALERAKLLLRTTVLDQATLAILAEIIDENESRKIPGVGHMLTALDKYKLYLDALQIYRKELPQEWIPSGAFDVKTAFEMQTAKEDK